MNGDCSMDFLHVGLKVDDIHRSTELYRTLFGIDWERFGSTAWMP